MAHASDEQHPLQQDKTNRSGLRQKVRDLNHRESDLALFESAVILKPEPFVRKPDVMVTEDLHKTIDLSTHSTHTDTNGSALTYFERMCMRRIGSKCTECFHPSTTMNSEDWHCAGHAETLRKQCNLLQKERRDGFKLASAFCVSNTARDRPGKVAQGFNHFYISDQSDASQDILSRAMLKPQPAQRRLLRASRTRESRTPSRVDMVLDNCVGEENYKEEPEQEPTDTEVADPSSSFGDESSLTKAWLISSDD